MTQYIVFSHGKDGEPWGSKITAMAEIAANTASLSSRSIIAA